MAYFLRKREKMPTEKKNRFPRRRTLTKKNFEKLKKSKSSENRKGIHGDFKSPQRLEEEIRSLCRSLGQEATVHLLKVLLQFQEKSSHPVRNRMLRVLFHFVFVLGRASSPLRSRIAFKLRLGSCSLRHCRFQKIKRHQSVYTCF